jgi:hypothetical protein
VRGAPLGGAAAGAGSVGVLIVAVAVVVECVADSSKLATNAGSWFEAVARRIPRSIEP